MTGRISIPAQPERDYLKRTIATVRNHRDADNCWPQWANIFADEIERLWERESALVEAVEAAQEAHRIKHYTIPMLREEFGDDWAAKVGDGSARLDAALARFDFWEETP